LRLLPAALLSPFLGGPAVPRPARLALAFGLGAAAACASGAAAPAGAALLPAAVREMAFGVALGLCASLPLEAARAGGRLADTLRGATLAELHVAPLRQRESALGDLLAQWTPVLAASAGADRLLLSALLGTFRALPAGSWRLLLDEVPVASGSAETGRALSLAPPEDLELVGIEAQPASHPLTGARGALFAAAEARRAAVLGPVLGPLDRVLAGAAAGLCRNAHHLVGVEEVQALLASLEERAPALAREASRHIPPALLAEVLRRLLEEGVPVRALRTVVQAVLEAGAGARPAWQLAEHCRRALGRHLAHRLAEGGPLEVLLLDPETEARIRGALAAGRPALDPPAAGELLDRLAAELCPDEGTPVLLTSTDVRRAVRDLVAPRHPRLSVLSYEELPPEWPVRPRARIAVSA
jgi:type III secretion protein V